MDHRSTPPPADSTKSVEPKPVAPNPRSPIVAPVEPLEATTADAPVEPPADAPGRGWKKSRCVEATSTFEIDVDDRVNICVRVVHPPDVEESLSVEWSKVGTKTVRKSSISIKAMHAYLSRGYLPIKPGYEGEWTAVVKPPDGTVLATLPFVVE